jgi:molybdenum-dependent DNA-binding transcriptional regulator ModE
LLITTSPRRSAFQVIERLEAMLDKAMVEAREGRKVCQRCPREH